MTQVTSDKFWQAEAKSKPVYTGRHLEIIQGIIYGIAREQRHDL